jgi:hypothetical protein
MNPVVHLLLGPGGTWFARLVELPISDLPYLKITGCPAGSMAFQLWWVMVADLFLGNLFWFGFASGWLWFVNRFTRREYRKQAQPVVPTDPDLPPLRHGRSGPLNSDVRLKNMKDAESKLPTNILEKAVISGNEYGWRRPDVVAVIKAAPSSGLAVLGGQIQFVVPDGTCELYWMNFDPTDRKPEESWEAYAIRSSEETLALVDGVMSVDLVQEGINHFGILKENQSQGLDLEQHLLFIVYFQAQEEAEQDAPADADKPRR